MTSFSSLLKSVLFAKLAKSLSLAKFACFNLKPKNYFVNVLTSGVVIYLSWLWSVIFFSISLIFIVILVILVKVSNIRYFTINLFILVLRVVLVAKLVMSGILSSIFLILALYTYFLTTSFFSALLNLLKSTGTGTNLSTSNLSSK